MRRSICVTLTVNTAQHPSVLTASPGHDGSPGQSTIKTQTSVKTFLVVVTSSCPGVALVPTEVLFSSQSLVGEASSQSRQNTIKFWGFHGLGIDYFSYCCVQIIRRDQTARLGKIYDQTLTPESDTIGGLENEQTKSGLKLVPDYCGPDGQSLQKAGFRRCSGLWRGWWL